MNTKFQYQMTKEGEDPKGNPYKVVIAKNKVQKASFQKYGFKSAPIVSISKPGQVDEKINFLDTKKTTIRDMLDIIFEQEGKVTPKQRKMSKEQLIQEI